MDEVELIEKAKSGDRIAKERFFEIIAGTYQNKLLSYIYRKVFNIHDAFDILQETFEAVFLNLKMLRENSKFPAWIYLI